jgi:hypothetical protein
LRERGEIERKREERREGEERETQRGRRQTEIEKEDRD